MNYRVGNRVKIKNLDWYNEYKNETGYIHTNTESFIPEMSQYCGNILTIKSVEENFKYYLVEECVFAWTDEMIESIAEEIEIAQDTKTFSEGYNQGYEDGQHDMTEWTLPEGFEFTDENSNVINATKIVLKKKKKEYPKTYDECCNILNADEFVGYDLMFNFPKLLNARNAYWKIAGNEMGLGKPWKPDWMDENHSQYGLYEELKNTIINPALFVFPSEEMRNAFKENFKNLFELIKN